MKKILVQLTGDNVDIEDIKFGLKASVWKFLKESDRYYLTSESVEETYDHDEVLTEVNLLLDLLNGAANIIHKDHKKVGTGCFIEIDENGQRNYFLSIHEKVTVRDRCDAEVIREGKVVEEFPSKMEGWVSKAWTDESVRDALHFFNEISWWNLYKVFEIIRDDVGGKTQVYKITDKDELECFEEVAQRRDLLGDNARHASKSRKQPPKKMTLDEASNTIIKLFETWIDSK